MSVVVWETNLACCPILMSAWVYVSPVCNTEIVLKQVRIWFKSLSLWGSLISCWRNQLFSKMYVTVAEWGVPSAVRKLDSTKWCLCFRWLHCISSWSLLNVGLHFEREVLVCSVRAAAQGKASTVFLLIHLCSNPQNCVTGRNNSTVQRTAGSEVNFFKYKECVGSMGSWATAEKLWKSEFS